ncbi:MAG: Membrane protein implicated in regulation of membrane protease activity [Rhodobacteraceae bacterium HLUCCA12]|nr:MAG: Membrane protein implicated in regulation of membrane protease activity [Rhodobacteraceae bacterium HLUCCA12]
MLALWWVWVALGLVLAIVELAVPGYLFVGFAIGAALTGAAIGLGVPGGAWMTQEPVNALMVFAVLSVVAWLVLRRTLGVRKGQTRRFDHDINED